MHIRFAAAFLLLAGSGVTSAQQLVPLVPQAGPDIVVHGSHEQEDPDYTNSQPMIVTGSRIKHMSLQHSPFIASATSLGGLTSESAGFDGVRETATKRWTSCKVTGAVISKATACALVVVEKSLAKPDYPTAQRQVRDMLANPTTVADRYVLATYLFRIGEAMPDLADKRTALTIMVETGVMPPLDEIAALKTLASMAYKSGQQTEALARYRQIAERFPDDTDSRVNASVMLQYLGQGDAAKVELRGAIATAQRTGRDVPQAWIDGAR